MGKDKTTDHGAALFDLAASNARTQAAGINGGSMNEETTPAQVPAVIEPQRVERVQAASNTPADLLRIAVETGADVDRLAKLMDLQERWQAGQAKREFVEAMARMQSRLPTITKSNEVKKSNGDRMYRFANLDDIIRAIRPIEHECGFIHRFEFQPREGGGCITTCVVTHTSGHSERTTVTIPATKGMNTNAAQDNGIEMTYGQRYSLIGAYGITTANQDTDGNTGGQDYQRINAKQAQTLRDMCADTGTAESKVSAAYGVAKLEEIPSPCYDAALKQLNRKLDAKIGGDK